MRLYQFPQSPNPRRVRIFMVEKGMDRDAIELAEIDIRGVEHNVFFPSARA